MTPNRLTRCHLIWLATALAIASWACSSGRQRPAPPPPPRRPEPPKPLSTNEIQQLVDGAARLNRSCRDRRSESGLYKVRLMIEPDGRVSRVEPMRAPTRAEDPAAFAGVPRYLDGDHDPETPVIRCFADAFGKLRFRRFPGEAVAFDYPIVVENLPPSEAESEARRCEADEDCVFRPSPPCSCRPCGRSWRRSINRITVKRWRKRWRRQRRWRCRRWRRRRRRCPKCNEPLVRLGKQALCLDGQCSVR
jgi:hypothetical protein